ncbi:MAG: aspartate-semialdehyde dehydrogenase [Firmicutes bacterium]|jgi:aspartate-semialdehyde dehydrogenase|nr:aspartate-semialdehyde dehydrogenase [Bacillota bacterium]
MKLRVAVVGATGIAGQQFMPVLNNHPWFEVKRVAASKRSAGKTYREALTDANGSFRYWAGELPKDEILDLTVEDAAELNLDDIDLVFAAVESDAARELEPLYAKTTPVISTASAFRYEEDTPIMVAGVNMDHAELIKVQQKRRGWKGFIVPIPNCTVTGLVVTLKPLVETVGVEYVLVTTMQALSGAGRSPGVLGLDIIDNVIPYIPGEEGKVEREGQKILGTLAGDRIEPMALPVSATCTRVPVLDGHTEAVFVAAKRKADLDEVKEAMASFGKEFVELGLPSAPDRLIHVHDDEFRPQPRFDRELGGGMTTSVGRLRHDHVLPNGLKYVLLSHNTKMGAAKGAVLTAEYLVHAGYIPRP